MARLSSDEEAEEWRFMLFETRDDALNEACDQAGEDYVNESEVPGPEGHFGVEPTEVPIGLAPLQKLTGFAMRADDDASDAIAVAFAMLRGEELTGRPFDGVWWRETYAPELLSSPRGGIFPERVPLRTAARGFLNEVDDDVELDTMPPRGRRPDASQATCMLWPHICRTGTVCPWRSFILHLLA